MNVDQLKINEYKFHGSERYCVLCNMNNINWKMSDHIARTTFPKEIRFIDCITGKFQPVIRCLSSCSIRINKWNGRRKRCSGILPLCLSMRLYNRIE